MEEQKFEDQFSPFGEVERRGLSNFQKVVARRMTRSWTEIPHVTNHDELDVTALEQHRAALPKDNRPSALIYLAKALGRTLGEFPTFNSSLTEDGKALILKKYFNVGIAVDGPLGLLVPVLRNVDSRSVTELNDELRQVSTLARSKGLAMEAMSGGCMTISSLGGIGGTGFTPIINQPEVAILGVMRTTVAPVWDGETFQPRSLMPVSLSYDHRVINGADAARFLRRLSELIGAPSEL